MKNLLYILISIILLSCGNTISSAQKNTAFKAEENLNPKPFINFLQDRGVKMFLVDSLLLVKNYGSQSNNYHFYVYNLTTRKLTDSLFKIGSDSTEVLNVFDAGLIKNKIWAYDISSQKVLMGDVSKQTNNKQRAINAFQMKRPGFFAYYSVQLNDSLQLFTNGNYIEENKIQKINLPTGKLLKAFGTYNNIPKNMSPMAWRGANESRLYLQPNGTRLVSANRYADKIEIFDLKTTKSKIISGPENFEPEVEAFKKEGLDVVTRNEKTKIAFVGGYTTDQYIYLLYSGSLQDNPNFMNGKTIFVYDWAGNPIKKYNLPYYISCFSVSANNKQIYVYDAQENKINAASLNL